MTPGTINLSQTGRKTPLQIGRRCAARTIHIDRKDFPRVSTAVRMHGALDSRLHASLGASANSGASLAQGPSWVALASLIGITALAAGGAGGGYFYYLKMTEPLACDSNLMLSKLAPLVNEAIASSQASAEAINYLQSLPKVLSAAQEETYDPVERERMCKATLGIGLPGELADLLAKVKGNDPALMATLVEAELLQLVKEKVDGGELPGTDEEMASNGSGLLQSLYESSASSEGADETDSRVQIARETETMAQQGGYSPLLQNQLKIIAFKYKSNPFSFFQAQLAETFAAYAPEGARTFELPLAYSSRYQSGAGDSYFVEGRILDDSKLKKLVSLNDIYAKSK